MARVSHSFFAADCETDPFDGVNVPAPFIWGIYGGPDSTYYEFATVEEFVGHIRETKCIIYFHNGGKFDGFFLRDYANADEPLLIINGRLSRFRIGLAEIRDSMNILPVALKEFKKDKIDYSLMLKDNRDIPNNRALIRDYLRSDCMYLHELISAHRREHGVTLTQAGAALRASYKSKKTKPPRQSVSDFHTYRPFFAGGRTQCFLPTIVEGVDIHCWDVNSAYPYAMLFNHPYATRAVVQTTLPSMELLPCSLIEFDGISRGALYYRDEKGGMYYPDGIQVLRYRVPGYELLAGLETGCVDIVRVIAAHVFGLTINFSEFIHSNFEKRKQAKTLNDVAMSTIYKLNMNSAYGKNGADPTEYEEFILGSPEKIADHLMKGYEHVIDWTPDLKLMSRMLPDEKQRFYNVALAASVTGFQRGVLWRAIHSATGMVYCDTDSIFAQSAKLNTGNELGQWKYEETYDACYVAGKKLYAMHRKGHPETDERDEEGKYLHYKIACKGAQLKPSEIIRIARGEKIIYAPQAPTFSPKLAAARFVPRSIEFTAKDIRHV